MKKVDVIKKNLTNMGEEMAKYYDQLLLSTMGNASIIGEEMYGKIIGYKNIKVPIYLTIKVPVVEKDYDNDSEFGDGSFRGLLISLREIKLFRIGTKIERLPIRRRVSGKTIKWKRYGDL